MEGIFVVRHYAGIAHDAMHRQYERLISSSPPRLDDGYLFALSLADLLKAARVAKAHAADPAPLKKALSDFERSVSQAKDFRDLLEHWDEYAAGKGRKQKQLGLAHGVDCWFWWTSISPPVLRIGGSKAGLDLDVTAATKAGAALFVVVRRVLDPMEAMRRASGSDDTKASEESEMGIEGKDWHWRSGSGVSVQIGYVNPNSQRCCGHRGVPGTDHDQLAYKVECAICGYVYGANGSDMHERRCPIHQGGAPGIPFWQA